MRKTRLLFAVGLLAFSDWFRFPPGIIAMTVGRPLQVPTARVKRTMIMTAKRKQSSFGVFKQLD